jgi:hypothetical protein
LHSSRRHELPVGWVGFVEILILAPLAAFLVLGVIPAAFGIEWERASGYGIVHTAGDSYLTSFAVAGTAGWLAIAAWVIFSLISERRRAAMLVARVVRPARPLVRCRRSRDRPGGMPCLSSSARHARESRIPATRGGTDMTLLWFVIWLVANVIGDDEPLTFDPVNWWAGTLILVAALDLARQHAPDLGKQHGDG